MRHASKFLAAAAGLACAAGLAFAADQTILGKSLTVKQKPGDSTSRKVTASGKEKGSSNTLLGNPTLSGSAGGAILEVFANGGSSTSQTFTLQQGTSSTGKAFWSAAGSTGFKYKDGKGDQGAVKAAQIKRTPSGNFSIKVKIAGKNGPVTVVPPNPGTSGCVALTLTQNGTGDRYSVQFGADSQIKNSGDKLFKAKKPTLEGICPSGPPTTTTTTVVTTTIVTTTVVTTTTTTTIYGSPSRAFLATPVDLLD